MRLSSPTMHGEEQKWVDEAIRMNPRLFYRYGSMEIDNEKYSFIRAFILQYVAKVDCKEVEIKFPYYKEFVIREYDVCIDQYGDKEFIPAGFGEKRLPDSFKLTDEKVYDSRYDFTKVYRAKERYPDLIAIFESDGFPLYRNYMALKAYYEKLIANIDEGEDDSLDFL